MAGIGFKIEKILRTDTIYSSIKAHFYSAIIAAGPWFLSILTIFSLYYFKPNNIDYFENLLFRTTFNYIFAASLIFTGTLYLSLSRYLADKLYLEDTEALAPAFNASTLIIILFQIIVGVPYMLLAEGDPLIKFLSLLIYAAVSLIWVIFIFLTALRDYNSIALGYVIGTVITIFGALILGRYFDLIGYFIGTLLGQFTIMILLSARIYIEFPSKRIFDKKLFSFLSNNKILILTGIFYNLAIWIDKIVFWYSPGSIRITNFLRMFPDYEIASFFAYMTIIPFLSIFMIHVETHFYLRYRTYYEYILNKGSYREIKAAKKEIKGSLRFGIAILIASQSVLTIVTIIFAPNIINALALPPSIISIFRICVLGAFLHGLLLVNIIAILYFDFKVLALLVCTTFMLLNGLFAYVTTMLPTPYIGTGYLLATILSLILSFYALNKHLKKLEFITFSKQSI